jgi:general secretion pathway protein H
MRMSRTQRGFTLIEIMVVITIVAVLMGAVTLSFPRTGDNLLKEQAERFAALISLAQDEAILQSRELALFVSKTGYVFYQNQNSSWVPYSSRPFSQRTYPGGITASTIVEGVDLDFKDNLRDAPQIIIFSSGEMTPFTYVFNYQNKSKITLEVSATGDIEKILELNEL